MSRKLFVCAVTILFLAGGTAHARDRDDEQDKAREALRRGEVIPIAQILGLVSRQASGDVISVNLDSSRGRFFYRGKVLTPEGRVRELKLDARSGALVTDGR
jgi:uncharacterized membrane protein YkoI